jgi:hypothetical protein
VAGNYTYPDTVGELLCRDNLSPIALQMLATNENEKTRKRENEKGINHK